MNHAHAHQHAKVQRARHNHKGGVSVIVLAAAAVVAIVGIFLFVSKPWQQRLKDGIRDVTEWTPENIVANKAGYLNWAIDELQKHQKKLEARAFSLAKREEEARQEKGKYEGVQKAYEKLVEEGKVAYKEAEKNGKWPDKWKDVKIGSKREFQVQILTADRDAQNAAKLVETHKNLEQRALRELTDVKEYQVKIKTALSKLETDKEILKATEQIKDITDLHNDVKNILVNAGVIVSDQRTIKDVAAENVQAQKAGTTEEDFAKLMAR
ncbi:MAG: hypothetical protein LBS59_00865 [Puniceicoccales bacterium]|jgi:hypothetical protein|nr:hypothetical protein [Puniceicoccales bacterium]